MEAVGTAVQQIANTVEQEARQLFSPYRFLRRLKLGYRDEDARRHLKMVLPPGPVDKSQHRMEGLSRRISHMVL